MIWKLLLSKDSLYIAIILAMIGGSWYILDDWHYKPLRIQEKTVKMLSEQLNTCITERDSCESKISQQTVQGFQEGLGDGDETINIDLDNLTSN